MVVRSRAPDQKRRRKYAGGKPARHKPCDRRFGRFVDRGLRDAHVSAEALSQAIYNRYCKGQSVRAYSDVSRQNISKIAAGKGGASPKVAWMIGQTLRVLGVPWSSGLLALAAAGYHEQLLGAIGWLLRFTFGHPEFSGTIRDHWSMLRAAPFDEALEPIMEPRRYASKNLLHAPRCPVQHRTRRERERCVRDRAARYRHYFDEESGFESLLNELGNIRQALERGEHYSSDPLAEQYAILTMRCSARLARLAINDELVVACELAWLKWSNRNERDGLPNAYRRAFDVLDRSVDPCSYSERVFAWTIIKDWFCQVDDYGFENVADLFRLGIQDPQVREQAPGNDALRGLY